MIIQRIGLSLLTEGINNTGSMPKSSLTQILTTIAAVVLLGCGSNPKRVSGPEFQDCFRSGTGSMHIYEYIGEKDGKFYLRHLSMSLISKRKWNEKILYTEDSEFDETFLKQLRDQSKTIENLETKDK